MTETAADNRPGACFGCMNGACRTKAARPVETGVTASALAGQIVTVLCPPLLGFAAVYALTGLAVHTLGEGAGAACGVLGLFAAAGLVYFIRRKFPSNTKTG